MPAFTGSFRTDSPALHTTLKRFLAAQDLARLEEIWQLIFREAGFVDPEIEGARESSYQARPARICHILVQDLRERRPEMLAAAMLITAAPGYPPSAAPRLLREGLGLAQQARLIAGGGAGSPDAEKLFGAELLDAARHLHFSPRPIEERRAKLEAMNSGAEVLAQNPANARLVQLLRKTLERQRLLVEQEGP